MLDVRDDASVAACVAGVGAQAKFVGALKWFTPEGAFERGARSTFRLDPKS